MTDKNRTNRLIAYECTHISALSVACCGHVRFALAERRVVPVHVQLEDELNPLLLCTQCNGLVENPLMWEYWNPNMSTRVCAACVSERLYPGLVDAVREAHIAVESNVTRDLASAILDEPISLWALHRLPVGRLETWGSIEPPWTPTPEILRGTARSATLYHGPAIFRTAQSWANFRRLLKLGSVPMEQRAIGAVFRFTPPPKRALVGQVGHVPEQFRGDPWRFHATADGACGGTCHNIGGGRWERFAIDPNGVVSFEDCGPNPFFPGK